MPGMTPEQITEAKGLITKAHEEVERLATGESRWRMTIPANPDRDSDLVISAGLGIGTSLIAEVDQLRESMSWIEARGVVFALERDEARSAGERVKALHSPKPGTRIVPCSLHAPHDAWPPGRCPDCTSEPTDVCSHCVGQASPCPTLRALDGGETP